MSSAELVARAATAAADRLVTAGVPRPQWLGLDDPSEFDTAAFDADEVNRAVAKLRVTKRWPVVLALAVTVVAGLGVRHVTGGAFGKYAGDALYATAVYWCVVLVRPALRRPVAAVLATGICWAIELFQLTPVPRTLSSHSTLSRLVLGSTFGGWDMLAYPVGVMLAVAVHALLSSLSRALRTG